MLINCPSLPYICIHLKGQYSAVLCTHTLSTIQGHQKKFIKSGKKALKTFTEVMLNYGGTFK